MGLSLKKKGKILKQYCAQMPMEIVKIEVLIHLNLPHFLGGVLWNTYFELCK